MIERDNCKMFLCVCLVIWSGALAPALAQGDRLCGHPAVPPNARVSLPTDTKIVPGTVATYECDEGYELFGAHQRECTLRGDWTAEPPFCGTNVAFRKPANQSTTVRGGSASNGNDGEKTTEHDGKRCTETQREASPWWQVDLLRHYAVKVVRVTTRGCCGHQPLQDLEIRVGNSSSDLQRNPLCAWFPGTMDEGVTKTFTCARPLIGQHVFLQLVGVEGSLSLCEVEVFTTEEFSNDRCAPVGASADIELAAFSRNCYEFNVAKGASFEEARKQCKAHGGDLIHGFQGATSSYLIQELERRKTQLKTQLVWIGAQKEPGLTSRTWKWVDGEMVSKPTWGKDQPNNYNGEQNCVVLDGGRAWLWNDVGCNLDYLHWICQYLPPSCGSPDKLLNTTIEGNSYQVESSIAYKCPDGHMLIGDKTRKCKKDGFWSGAAPSCKYVNCGGLTPIQDGDVSLVDGRTTHGARAVYSCKENYTLVGNEERHCGDEGIWDGEAPKCLFDWCPEPPPVTGATVSVSGHKAGSLATYMCQNGFILFGQPSVTCNLGGVWSGTPPSCKYVDCGTPAQVHKGSFVLLNGTTTYGSVAQFNCESDYWLAGAEVLTCNRDGKWSHDIPSCELISCPDPEVPAGGYMEAYDYNVHSTIDFHCEKGHKLVGEPNLTCQPDGEWSGESPKCDYVDCGKLPPLPYGLSELLNGTTHLGSVIQYACTTNYRLVGAVRRVCTEDHQWSDSSPRCEEIRCTEPIVAENSIVSVTGNDRMHGRTLIRTSGSTNNGNTYRIGALVKYRCERGYKVVGESLSTCEDTGQWSGVTPRCQYVDCGNPGRIQNGKVTLATNATYYGAAALYECDEHWQLDGVSRRLCQDNGTWSSEAPVCKEITCTDPSIQIKGSTGLLVVTSTLSIGGEAHYRCERGYSIKGNQTRTCLPKGQWYGTPPVCIPIDCKSPGTIENGRIIISNTSTLFGSSIEYHCLPQYQRVGPFLRKCLDDGKWSGEDPRCELTTNEAAESGALPLSVGVGCGVVLFLLMLLGVIYLRLRKATPVKNTENIEGAERKEDQNAAVMSYATLHDTNGRHIYDHVTDNLYDSPYSESLAENAAYGRRSDTDSAYEPEPTGPSAVVTINGVAVR
ncbi:sushi, von Willebrand factor type A, EGF and pentraxin domain-containing protein 1 [Vanessa tameamea]|uniref:Sushi, von Willebrand factor type A, EGF and pentraxin domain-containing protein 1 n=1 Tax=Vanessa tameamea TaxID=334116 RepID=A0A8B8IY63_VANTA